MQSIQAMIRRTTACVKDLSELSSLRGEKRNKFDAKTARSGSIVCVPSDGSSFCTCLCLLRFGRASIIGGGDMFMGGLTQFRGLPRISCLLDKDRTAVAHRHVITPVGRNCRNQRWVRILFVSLNFDSSFVRYSTPSCKLNRQTLLGFATQFFT